MTFPLYAFGYTGRKIDTLVQNVERADAMLLDIRYSPRSRAPMWNRRNLEEAFGERYLWAGDILGNRLYRTDAIEIVDIERGLELVAILAAKGPVALMCVCVSPVGCHRTVISDALRARGFVVLDYPPASFGPGEFGAGAPESNRDTSTEERPRSPSELPPRNQQRLF